MLPGPRNCIATHMHRLVVGGNTAGSGMHAMLLANIQLAFMHVVKFWGLGDLSALCEFTARKWEDMLPFCTQVHAQNTQAACMSCLLRCPVAAGHRLWSPAPGCRSWAQCSCCTPRASSWGTCCPKRWACQTRSPAQRGRCGTDPTCSAELTISSESSQLAFSAAQSTLSVAPRVPPRSHRSHPSAPYQGKHQQGNRDEPWWQTHAE